MTILKEVFTKSSEKASVSNIYQLDGKVPVSKAIPFGLQHVLAMFVANISPIIIVAGAANLSSKETAALIQCAMLIAGIGTIIQLYPVWRIGSKLPVVMGISFTFVSLFCVIAAQYGYNAIVGAVIVGGILEGILGLFAKYWRKLITPVVSASVVTAIGFSLLNVGATSFGGGDTTAPDFGCIPRNNKPPAMPVCPQTALASSKILPIRKKPPVLIIFEDCNQKYKSKGGYPIG